MYLSDPGDNIFPLNSLCEIKENSYRAEHILVGRGQGYVFHNVWALIRACGELRGRALAWHVCELLLSDICMSRCEGSGVLELS